MAYGLDNAKTLEMQLLDKIKNRSEFLIKKMTIQELYNEYIEAKSYEVRKRTILLIQYIYDKHIFPMFQYYHIEKITVKNIQEWKISIEKKNLSLNTKKSLYMYFNSMINYAVKMEYLPKNPLSILGNFKDSLKLKTKMNFYTPQEFKVFINEIREIAVEKAQNKKDLSEWNYYVFFNIAFYTGLRKGEIYALKWSDIDGIYLTVSRSLFQFLNDETSPKNISSIRTVQMPLPLINVLNEHRQRQQKLFNFNDDFRLCDCIKDTALYKRNELYSEKAGLKTIRIHDFRHPYVKPTLKNFFMNFLTWAFVSQCDIRLL